MKLLLKILVGVVLSLVVAFGVLRTVYSASRPAGGATGAPADELAREVGRAVNLDAWARTNAVEWTWGGKNKHLWDRTRGLDRVAWKDVEVLVDLSTQDGVAKKGGKVVEGAEKDALVAKAYAAWINDSFWLNPIAKLFDEGVTRTRIEAPDGRAGDVGLLVSYSSGGLTPGDAYLWIAGRDAPPVRWRMWVSNIPVPGIETTWEGWQTLSTGAKVSTSHVLPPGIRLELRDVSGAATLAELTGGVDPFLPLVGEKR